LKNRGIKPVVSPQIPQPKNIIIATISSKRSWNLPEPNSEVITMAELLQESTTEIEDDGTTYVVRSFGEERIDGTWSGWIEFYPNDKDLPVLRTQQETSQPNRTTIEYWATGLEPIYFEGALERAKHHSHPRFKTKKI